MPNVLLISDTHFSHRGIVKFLNDDGSKTRPWDNTEEMDEALVENWNSVVRPQDRVYHLGDVVINRSALPILSRLNGEKILVMGNHDVFRREEYAEYFKEVRGVWMLDKFVLSHIPLHHTSVIERWEANIHGHLHSNRVMLPPLKQDSYLYPEEIDPLYYSVCVEQINYTPISLDELKLKVKEQQNAYY